jgi:hypothetical protein
VGSTRGHAAGSGGEALVGGKQNANYNSYKYLLTCRFGTGRQRWSLYDGQIPNPNVVRLTPGTVV